MQYLANIIRSTKYVTPHYKISIQFELFYPDKRLSLCTFHLRHLITIEPQCVFVLMNLIQRQETQRDNVTLTLQVYKKVCDELNEYHN